MRKNGEKISFTVNVSKDALEFLQSKVEDKTFSSLSHGVELALAHLKKELEEQ